MWRWRLAAATSSSSFRRQARLSNSPSVSESPALPMVHSETLPSVRHHLFSHCSPSKPSFYQNPRFLSVNSSVPIDDNNLVNPDVDSSIFSGGEGNEDLVFDESTSLNLTEERQEGLSSPFASSGFDGKKSFSFEEEWSSTYAIVNDGTIDENTGLKLEEIGEEPHLVEDDIQEVDFEKLEGVLSLLQSRSTDDVGGFLESKLEVMSLTLNEDFVIRVLETPLVPGENLISFFKWAAFTKKEMPFMVTTRSLDALVQAICLERRKKVAYNLWDLVKELGERENGVVTTEILNELISVFSLLGKGMAGYEVFNSFGKFFCVPNDDTFFHTIEALCRRSIFDLAGIVCEKMLNEGKLPEPEKVGKIICHLCKGSKVKEAHSVYVLAKGDSKYPPLSSINHLINSLCGRNMKDGNYIYLALHILEDFSTLEQRKYAIKPFSCVVRGLCRINDIEVAKNVLFKMVDLGPPPGNSVFNAIISALSKAGDIEEAMKIMRIMESRGLKPDVYTYSVIMSGYSRGGEMEEACKVLAEAKKNHAKLSPVTYHTIIRGYCKIEEFDKALKYLGEMEKSGVMPSTDEYNKLIQSLCLKAANWEMAEKLMEEMTEKGLHLNGITRGLIRAVKELEEEGVTTKQ